MHQDVLFAACIDDERARESSFFTPVHAHLNYLPSGTSRSGCRNGSGGGAMGPVPLLE